MVCTDVMKCGKVSTGSALRDVLSHTKDEVGSMGHSAMGLTMMEPSTGYFGTQGDDVFHFPPDHSYDFAYMRGGDDIVFGDDANNIVGGGEGDDDIFGVGGDDLLFGGLGNDALFGNGGNDQMFGGAGNDSLGGGIGDDTVWAGAGNDVVYDNEGNDRSGAGAGNDTVYGGAGDDTIYGGEGNDLLVYDDVMRHQLSVERIQDGGYRIHHNNGDTDTIFGFEEIRINNVTYDWSDFLNPPGSSGPSGPEPFDPGVITRNPDGTIDPVGMDGDEPFRGDGNDEHNNSVNRNETRELEAAAQVKLRGGASFDPVSVDPDGTVHFEVPSGEGAPGRALWNYDYSILSFGSKPLTDYTVTLSMDIDPSDAVDYLVLNGVPGPAADGGALIWHVGGTPVIADDAGDGFGFVTQNSQNVGFYEHLMDMDDTTAGIQPYDFSGGAEFDYLIQIHDPAGNLLLDNHVVVHVEDPMVI